MPENRPSLEETVSPDASTRTSAAVARFEEAWRAGQQPSLSDYLVPAPEPEWSEVFRQLLQVDREYRSRQGEPVPASRYYELFPDHVALIDRLYDSSPPAAAKETADWQPPSLPADDPLTNPLSGRSSFGRFELIRVLGSGAFGTVYHARDPRLDREVALKIPQPAVIVNPDKVERFLREARAAAQLRHANIVPVYEAGELNGTCYLVNGYIRGRSLRDVLREMHEQKASAPRDAAAIVAKLADALDYAHHQGIVHRDVKPENVIMDEQGEPNITDFGLARRREHGEELLTLEGIAMGTPPYMSPEQARGDSHAVDGRADQWSLGVILYELLTGRRPFSGHGLDVLTSILTAEPEPPQTLNPSVAPELQAICLRCLQKSPAQRFATCAELRNALDNFLQSPAGRPAGPGGAAPAPHSRPAWKRPLIWGVAGGAALLLIAVAIVVTVNRANHEAEPNPPAGDAANRTGAETGNPNRGGPPASGSEWNVPLRDYLDTALPRGWNTAVGRQIYSDVSTALDGGQNGEWILGWGLSRDKQAHVFTTRNGAWFAKTISPDEARKKGVEPKALSRSVDASFRIRSMPLLTLRDAKLRLVRDADGGRHIRGTVHCVSSVNAELRDVQVILETLLDSGGREGTRQSYQHLKLTGVPSGVLKVEINVSRGTGTIDLSSSAQLYLHAFVLRKRPAVYRISNTLQCRIEQ